MAMTTRYKVWDSELMELEPGEELSVYEREHLSIVVKVEDIDTVSDPLLEHIRAIRERIEREMARP